MHYEQTEKVGPTETNTESFLVPTPYEYTLLKAGELFELGNTLNEQLIRIIFELYTEKIE